MTLEAASHNQSHPEKDSTFSQVVEHTFAGLARDAYVLSHGLTAGFSEGEDEARQNPLATSLKLLSSVAIGAVLAYGQRRAGLLRLGSQVAGSAFGISFAADVLAPQRFHALADALRNSFYSSSATEQSIAAVRDNAGRLAFDTALMSVGGSLGVAGARLDQHWPLLSEGFSAKFSMVSLARSFSLTPDLELAGAGHGTLSRPRIFIPEPPVNNINILMHDGSGGGDFGGGHGGGMDFGGGHSGGSLGGGFHDPGLYGGYEHSGAFDGSHPGLVGFGLSGANLEAALDIGHDAQDSRTGNGTATLPGRTSDILSGTAGGDGLPAGHVASNRPREERIPGRPAKITLNLESKNLSPEERQSLGNQLATIHKLCTGSGLLTDNTRDATISALRQILDPSPTGESAAQQRLRSILYSQVRLYAEQSDRPAAVRFLEDYLEGLPKAKAAEASPTAREGSPPNASADTGAPDTIHPEPSGAVTASVVPTAFAIPEHTLADTPAGESAKHSPDNGNNQTGGELSAPPVEWAEAIGQLGSPSLDEKYSAARRLAPSVEQLDPASSARWKQVAFEMIQGEHGRHYNDIRAAICDNLSRLNLTDSELRLFRQDMAEHHLTGDTLSPSLYPDIPTNLLMEFLSKPLTNPATTPAEHPDWAKPYVQASQEREDQFAARPGNKKPPRQVGPRRFIDTTDKRLALLSTTLSAFKDAPEIQTQLLRLASGDKTDLNFIMEKLKSDTRPGAEQATRQVLKAVIPHAQSLDTVKYFLWFLKDGNAQGAYRAWRAMEPPVTETPEALADKITAKNLADGVDIDRALVEQQAEAEHAQLVKAFGQRRQMIRDLIKSSTPYAFSSEPSSIALSESEFADNLTRLAGTNLAERQSAALKLIGALDRLNQPQLEAWKSVALETASGVRREHSDDLLRAFCDNLDRLNLTDAEFHELSKVLDSEHFSGSVLNQALNAHIPESLLKEFLSKSTEEVTSIQHPEWAQSYVQASQQRENEFAQRPNNKKPARQVGPRPFADTTDNRLRLLSSTLDNFGNSPETAARLIELSTKDKTDLNFILDKLSDRRPGYSAALKQALEAVVPHAQSLEPLRYFMWFLKDGNGQGAYAAWLEMEPQLTTSLDSIEQEVTARHAAVRDGTTSEQIEHEAAAEYNLLQRGIAQERQYVRDLINAIAQGNVRKLPRAPKGQPLSTP